MRFMALRVAIDHVRFFDKESARLAPFGFTVPGKHTRISARLGLPTLGEVHDLYVHALHPERLRVSNYATRLSATNVSVNLFVRTRMAEFYNGLFDEFQERHPGTFLQEYAWAARQCAPPCPNEPLSEADLVELGANQPSASPGGYVLSRLHYRYSKQELPLDPELATGRAVTGGLSMPVGAEGRADSGVRVTEPSAFVTRFIHVHRYNRPTVCEHPQRFRWGAPPVEPPGRPEVFIAENMSRKRRDEFGQYNAVPNARIEFAAVQGEGGAASAGPSWAPPFSCSSMGVAPRSVAWFGLLTVLSSALLWRLTVRSRS